MGSVTAFEVDIRCCKRVVARRVAVLPDCEVSRSGSSVCSEVVSKPGGRIIVSRQVEETMGGIHFPQSHVLPEVNLVSIEYTFWRIT